ncbi:UNVERIFIED_CONTAM: hypothetical protein FKN15_021109 [Acipenser sinensis]
MNPVLSLSQNNRISWIPSGAFSQQLHLRELYLQNNQLSDRGLQNDTFSKLRSLEYLDLSMNNLTRVPEGLPPGITILHLGKNRISSLSAEEARSVVSPVPCPSAPPPLPVGTSLWTGLGSLQLVPLPLDPLDHLPVALQQVPGELPLRSLVLHYLQGERGTAQHRDTAQCFPPSQSLLSSTRATLLPSLPVPPQLH